MKSRFATKYDADQNNVIKINYDLFGEIVKNQDRVKLSKQNTKLGPIPSFNTLPGNFTYKFNDITILGSCAQSCRGCYGMKGNYNFSGSVNAEAINTLMIRENMDNVFNQLREICQAKKFKAFRIHSNGDLVNFDEFMHWAQLAKECPETVFYCYTKQYVWIDNLFSFMDVPENFIINISVFDGYGEKEATSIFMAHRENCNIFIAENEHREIFDRLEMKICKCPAYARKIRKNGKIGGVKLQHDKKDPAKFTCLWCGLCQKSGKIISTLIH